MFTLVSAPVGCGDRRLPKRDFNRKHNLVECLSKIVAFIKEELKEVFGDLKETLTGIGKRHN